jgi:hypothetical protein
MDDARTVCEQQCSENEGCAGFFVFRAFNGAGYRCHGLADLGPASSEGVLTDIESESYKRYDIICQGCKFFSGPCKHAESGFCMGTIPGTDTCIPDTFLKCADKY